MGPAPKKFQIDFRLDLLRRTETVDKRRSQQEVAAD
jgi:hypothetical protein